jgi:hypothetical protein
MLNNGLGYEQKIESDSFSISIWGENIYSFLLD